MKSADAADPDGRVELPEPVADERGAIQQLVEADIKSAQLISSKAGSVRANHYHKADFHFMYVLTGSFDYFHRPAESDEEPRRVRLTAGEMIFTPPMVEHAVRFLEDSTLVNFSGRRRDQGSYEDDLVRVPLIPAE